MPHLNFESPPNHSFAPITFPHNSQHQGQGLGHGLGPGGIDQGGYGVDSPGFNTNLLPDGHVLTPSEYQRMYQQLSKPG